MNGEACATHKSGGGGRGFVPDVSRGVRVECPSCIAAATNASGEMWSACVCWRTC